MGEQRKRTVGDVVLEIRAKANRGEVEAAITELDALIATRTDKRIWEYEKAFIQVDKSAPSDALRVAKTFAAKYPECPHGMLLLATTLGDMKRFKEALAEVARSEGLTGPTSASRSTRTDILNASGRKAEARALTQFDASLPDADIRSLQSWAKINPPADEKQLGEVVERLRAAGETGERLAVFEAHWYMERGQIEKAADLFEAANERYPDYEPIIIRYAFVERNLGRHRSSEARLERAHDLNPTSCPIGGMLARAYFRRLKLFSAFRVIIKVIRRQLKLS